MRTLPDHIIQTLQPAAGMPEYRVLPYSAEKQSLTANKITGMISTGVQRVWHLKRSLWHPALFEDTANYSVDVGENRFISVRCNSAFGVLSACDGNTFEVYDKGSSRLFHYDSLQEFLDDGWILD